MIIFSVCQDFFDKFGKGRLLRSEFTARLASAGTVPDNGGGANPLLEKRGRGDLKRICLFNFDDFVKSPSAALRGNFVVAAHR
jgi:hypothetical protein